MANRNYPILIMAMLLGLSCSRSKITLPPDNANTNLKNTVFVSDAVMKNMEGIYKTSAGSQDLGIEFVCKVSKKKVSFFSNQSGIFIILNYGLNPQDSSLQFSGFWRFSEKPTQGIISFSVPKEQGAADLILNGIATSIAMQGNFYDDNGSGQALSIKFDRPFSDYTKTHPFMIFAHHGVQTTSDPPYEENSLNGVLHDEDYGVTGLEFDIHLTSDHVPICIHDPSINTRVTSKGPLSGDYIQFSFPFLEQYIRLIDGQKIPSLEQVLTAFIDSTNMKEMWMDVKGDPDIFKYMEPIVKNAYAHAVAVGRGDVIIIADLPSDKVIDEFQQQPSYGSSLPSMCELSIQKVLENKCQYYGPRYSQGLLLDEVAEAHANGIKVYGWTLNSKNLILDYMQNGKFDGFITDYPAYVNYYYYTLF